MSERSYKPFDGCLWIAPDEAVDTTVVRRRFSINDPTGAVLYITGLGYFEARLNGRPLTDDRLVPLPSDYWRRDLSSATYTVTDSFTHRIYYRVFSVEEYLSSGENLLEIELGGGWLTQSERVAEGKMNYLDRPVCIYRLVHEGGEVRSDGSEELCESVIRKSSLFIGEVIDYSAPIKPLGLTVMPRREESVFTEEDGAPDRIIREIAPMLIYSEGDRHIYDLGENVSALLAFTSRARTKSTYKVTYAENLNEDYTLNYDSTGAKYIGTSGNRQIQTDLFVTDGGCDRRFMPKFVWHAFRYAQLEGNVDELYDVRGCVINSYAPVSCGFSSDCEGANFLFDAYVRTQLASYHGSYPSDCPHRERLGYTGDGQICAESAMMLLDAGAIYKKWIRDILDGQDIGSGHIQHTAPFQGGGGGPGGWCSAVITVPYHYHRQYGGSDTVRDTLPAMTRWIEFTAGCMENGLVVREKEGGWCLGDWCMLPGGELPEPFVNTCWFVHALRLYRELTDYYGYEGYEDVDGLISICLEAVKRAYEEIRSVGAAQAYAAWIGIDDVAKCAEYYDALGRFDTGFLGTDILMEVLFDGGYPSVAHKLLSSEEQGSYLYMKRRGATTLWERWKEGSSHSHPMFGACCRQLFRGILGIRQDADSIGYSSVTIRPSLPEGMNYAEGYITTPRGIVSVKLEREGATVKVTAHADERIRCTVAE